LTEEVKGTRTSPMATYKLTYFEASVSRGEECRLALHLAGVDFEDHRIKSDEWAALKASTPFGSLPVLEATGKPPLAQSNAILAYVGRRYGLHPDDPWEAARHEAILASVEELRATLAPSGKIADPAEKKRVRVELAQSYMKAWGGHLDRQIQGPFVSGEQIRVADIKLFQIMLSFRRGALDHIPTNVFAEFAKLDALCDAVARHPKVAEWRARH
jgi:prostaglandin-H2 D-isomerase / glutathione transferase